MVNDFDVDLHKTRSNIFLDLLFLKVILCMMCFVALILASILSSSLSFL